MNLKKGILFKKNKKPFFPVIYPTMQIFIAMDYLILMFILENEKSACGKVFFSHPVKITGFMYIEYSFQNMCISTICTKA